jgi:extracellular elastinolytic metalloproteinase
MLHNVYAELVANHRYAQDAMTNPNGQAGNVVFMHLFIDSLSLLPCYPTCECLAFCLTSRFV